MGRGLLLLDGNQLRRPAANRSAPGRIDGGLSA